VSEISVNGQQRPHSSGTTVRDLVVSLTDRADGCAVAVNDTVVPRSDWSTHAVEAGDRVEVLTAVQGG
jgi:sulfur carrier protein